MRVEATDAFDISRESATVRGMYGAVPTFRPGRSV
jgi:hypothetical protein